MPSLCSTRPDWRVTAVSATFLCVPLLDSTSFVVSCTVQSAQLRFWTSCWTDRQRALPTPLRSPIPVPPTRPRRATVTMATQRPAAAASATAPMATSTLAPQTPLPHPHRWGGTDGQFSQTQLHTRRNKCWSSDCHPAHSRPLCVWSAAPRVALCLLDRLPLPHQQHPPHLCLRAAHVTGVLCARSRPCRRWRR